MKDEGALTYIFVIFTIIAFSIGALYQVEVYTKDCKLYDIRENRVYQQEKLIISGTVKNESNFKVNYCNLNIIIKQNSINTDLTKIKDELFKEKTFIDKLIDAIKGKKEEKPEIEENYMVVEKLLPHSSDTFSISVSISAKYSEPQIEYKLSCH
jgi:hypothetical protein